MSATLVLLQQGGHRTWRVTGNTGSSTRQRPDLVSWQGLTLKEICWPPHMDMQMYTERHPHTDTVGFYFVKAPSFKNLYS